jgi:hypothetical protein
VDDMLKGTYIFYEDGIEIYRSQNIITRFGKRFLVNYLAGNLAFNNKELSLGIANGTSTEYPVSISNTRLGFEAYKIPVNFGSIDIKQIFNANGTPVLDAENNPTFDYAVVYKSTIPQNLVGIINEVGIYPGGGVSQNAYSDKFLSDFSDNTIWEDVDGYNPKYATTPTPRIGDSVLEWKFANSDTTSLTKEYKAKTNYLDISGYSENDTLSIAYNRYDTNSSKIRIKFYSANGDYFYGDITPSSLAGNKIQEISMSTVFSNAVGTPNKNQIEYIGIELTRTSAASNSYIYLDGLRINDEDTFDPAYGLISRSILATPLTKIAGRQVDIEYRLSLGF